jgi:hypothetical protein
MARHQPIPNASNRETHVEIIDDTVLLADFERFLEHGEQAEQDDDAAEPSREALNQTMAMVWELTGFIDRHGRQLLELARRGAGESPMVRITGGAEDTPISIAAACLLSIVLDEADDLDAALDEVNRRLGDRGVRLVPTITRTPASNRGTPT